VGGLSRAPGPGPARHITNRRPADLDDYDDDGREQIQPKRLV